MSRRLVFNANIVEYLKEDAEMRDRFIGWAFNEDSNIKKFPEFVDALNKAFNTEWGKRVLDKLGDDEYMFLWKSNELNSRSDFIRNRERAGLPTNTDDEAYQNYEVERKKNVDAPTKPKDIYVIDIKRTVEVKGYTRKGIKVNSYKRTNTTWSSAQVEFLRQYKEDKISKRKTITDFQNHFKDSGKTSASIGAKLYRIK